jgi:hypothetical protein
MRFVKSTLLQKIAFLNLLIFIFTICYSTSCSHRSPYYRPGINPTVPDEISDEDVQHRVILIGDAGEPQKTEMNKLQQWASRIPQRTIIFFLGDNIYNHGMPPKEDSYRSEAERRILAQINVVRHSGARGVSVPGNHDWGWTRKDHLKTLLREQDFVLQHLPANSFLPANGCPGPRVIDMPGLRIIILDTDLWVNKDLKWGSPCENQNLEQVRATLEENLKTAWNRIVLVAAHHPLASHGTHGGFFTWQDHLFPLTRLNKWLWIPLPVVGSLYPILRWHVVHSPEDLSNPNYKAMIRTFEETFKANPPLIYASGHDHTLQVLKGRGAAYFLVSGAGSKDKIKPVSDGDDTIFAQSHPGFMVVDFLYDSRTLLRVVEPGETEVVFSGWLSF